MLIDEMLEYCKNDYSNKNRACTDCNHPCKCPGDCSKCLYQIHYDHCDPDARHSYTATIADLSLTTMYANTLSNTHQK